MLTGVWAVSSAKMNDGWLSDDAWRVGMSNPGVPALLSGREKLKDGRGSTDESDAVDGDLLKEELIAGECIELARATLPEDSLRGKEWNEAPMLLDISSSSGTGEERILDDRLGKRDGGGTRPNSSKPLCFVVSGDSMETGPRRDELPLSIRVDDASRFLSY
jgi:hypothetical protein